MHAVFKLRATERFLLNWGALWFLAILAIGCRARSNGDWRLQLCQKRQSCNGTSFEYCISRGGEGVVIPLVTVESEVDDDFSGNGKAYK